MGLDIYGGDVRVIAARDELARISSHISYAASLLRDAPLAPTKLLLDFLPNPLPNLQLAFLLPPVIAELERLAVSCHLAAESYFSTEAQVMHNLQQLFEPLSSATNLLVAPNPISVAMADVVSRTGAALAVVGLVTAPSLGSSQMIAQGARVISHAAGFQTPAAMLAAAPLAGAMGSAELLAEGKVLQSGSLAGLAQTLAEGYWSPPGAVRIQSFEQTSGRTLLVFIPGTQSFTPLSDNPLNIAANLGVFGGGGSASQAAVTSALAEFGAGKDDRVIFVGHSQGGIIAGNLAASKQPYEVAGLITLGSPVAQLDLKVPTVSIQHQQDPVPLLSGTTNPMRERWVTISSDRHFTDLVQAHHISSYTETAFAAGQSDNPGLENVLNQMQIPSGTGTEFVYRLKAN